MKRINTRYSGVFYRETKTKNRIDKTYYIRYKDLNNKDIEQKVGKQSEGIDTHYCNRYRNEIIMKQRLGEELPNLAKNKRSTKVLLDDIKEKYFENRKEGRSKQSDLASFKKHLEPFFKDLNLEFVSKEDIRSLQKNLKEKVNPRGEPLSTKTIHNILTILKSITNFALKEELLKNDYRKYIEMDSVRNKRERYLKEEEIKILFDYLKDDKKLYLFSKIALTTGARLASILFISKKDIDFSNNLITLYDFKKDQDGRVSYTAFLTDELSSLLKDWTINHELNEKVFNKNPTTIQKQMRIIINDLFNKGIDQDDRKNRAVVHTLRHTFASHLAINGTPIFTIQKLINHSDINMTMRYAKLSPESGKDAILNLKF